MRSCTSHSLTLLVLFGFGSLASAKTKLELTDPGLHLQELRPLDRRVYILTLDAKWNEPAAPKVTYYVNFLFPKGGSYAHKVLENDQFRKGEVRCVIQSYQLIRNGLDKRGKFSIVVSGGKPVTSAEAPEVVSDVLEVSWPMERFISRYRPRSRHSEAEDVDAFPIPGEKPPASSKQPAKSKKKSEPQD